MTPASVFLVQAAVADELRATAAYVKNSLREAIDAQAELRKALKDEQETAVQSNKKVMLLYLSRTVGVVWMGSAGDTSMCRTARVWHVPALYCNGHFSMLKMLMLST